MANVIKHKTNGVASVKPLAGDISLGELAINTADGLIFLKKIDGTIVEVGAGGASIFIGATAPADPATTPLWLDTSGNSEIFYVYDGSSWIDVTAAAGGGGGIGDMLAANNLSDLLDVAAARTNLNVDIAGNAAAMAIALG